MMHQPASVFLLALALSPVVLAHMRELGPRHRQLLDEGRMIRRQVSNATTPAAVTAGPVAPAATTPAAVVTPATTAAPVVVTSPKAAPATTAEGGLVGVLDSLRGAATAAPSIVVPTTAAPSSARPTTSAATTAVSSKLTSSATPSSSTTSSSSSTSATATAAPDTSNTTSSGLPHATLIAIIVVASVVGGIAIIWTIVRKVAFSPSKRFESKLAPIDFGPDSSNDFIVAPHGDSPKFGRERMNSEKSMMGNVGYGSGRGSLGRADSGRSAASAGLSEIPPFPPSAYEQGPPSHYQQQHFGVPPSQSSLYGGGQAGSFVSSGYPEQQQYNYADLQRAQSGARGYPAGGNYGYPQGAQGRDRY